jgi:hypothetical protein
MDINLLIFRDGHWVYRSDDQHALLADCAALLGWDLYPFDRWLFDSQNWSMYTRRRQDLIALRTELAVAYAKTSEPAGRELLLVTYCMHAWKSTRALERKAYPEIRELEAANGKAKTLHRTLKLNSSARKALPRRSADAGAHYSLHTTAFGL